MTNAANKTETMTKPLSPAQINVLNALRDTDPDGLDASTFRANTVSWLRARGHIRAAAAPDGISGIRITDAGRAALAKLEG